MTFAINSIDTLNASWDRSKTGTLTCDVIFVATSVVLVCLQVSGLQVLPGAVGTIGNVGVQGLIAAGGAVFVLDLALLGLRKPPRISQYTIHAIADKVYLSGSKGFNDAVGEGILFSCNANPKKLQIILTACPVEHILLDERRSYTAEDIKKLKQRCNEKGIEWITLGSNIGDDPNYWEDFVYNCTYPEHYLSQEPYETDPKKLLLTRIAKRHFLKDVPVQEWFEPVFTKLDEGFKGNKNLLVHCAQGVSRSSTLLVAYLIKRKGMDVAAAIDFLQSKRSVVGPRFVEALTQYQLALHKQTPV